MSKPMVRIHNIKTNEVIDREMTDEEFEIYQEEARQEAERLATIAEKTAKRTEILAKLGLTEEEIELLLS